MKRVLLIFFCLMILGCGKGTETGNPSRSTTGVTTPTDGQETGEETAAKDGPGAVPAPTSYANDTEEVTTFYAKGWTATEVAAPQAGEAMPNNNGLDTADAEPESKTEEPQTGIDTSKSASTIFSDGTSTVTFYYVLLSQEPASLETYLASAFPGRTFTPVSNSQISGFQYDQEYYFLNGTLLLYIVTDLIGTPAGFQTLMDGLDFE